MPAPVMWPSAYENMHGTSNLLPANRRKKPTVCWVIVRCLLSVQRVCVCVWLCVCKCYYAVANKKQNNMWLYGSCVNKKFKIARKQTSFVALISKLVSLWEQSQNDEPARRKTWTCLVSGFICSLFLCVCAHVSLKMHLSLCDFMRARKPARVCVRHIFFVQTSPVVTRLFRLHFVLQTDPVPGRK